MSLPDDIPLPNPASETEGSIKPNDAPSHRSIGPESEQRGGPEAVDESLDDKEETRPDSDDHP